MNIPKLQRTYKHLLAHMKKRNMRIGCITRTRSMCEHMIQHQNEFSSYPDYYEKFIDSDGFHKPNEKSRHLRSIWRSIWAFDEYDHLPDGTWFNPVGMSNKSVNKLNDNFRTFVDKEAIPAMNPDTVCETTVLNETCILSRFLLFMQENGATTLKKITDKRIMSYFFNDNGEQIRGKEVGIFISMLLKRIDNPECRRIVSLIPPLKKLDKKYTPVSDDTINLVKQELNKDDNLFSLRDKAIITIAIYTGMRGTDIANLRMKNIDWGRELITLIQSKTDQQLVLPLRVVVGNALFDYIKENKTIIEKDGILFHSEKDPSKPMKPAHVGNVVSRFFKESKLLNNGNPRRIRILRHRLASTLVKQGTDIQIIRSILGHTARKAINRYFDIDIEDIRKCGRDISPFPLKEGMLDI